MTNQPAEARLHYLDSLRGLAALAVVVGHYVAAYGGPPGLPPVLLWRTPLAATVDGNAAVSFFFVLSGFVLSIGFFRDPVRLHGRFSYGAFMIARVFRLWVPYAAVFLATWAVRSWLFDPVAVVPAQSPWLDQFWQQPFSVREALTELSLVIPPQMHRLIPPGWTLSMELSLSLLVPIGALLAERRLWWLVSLSAFGIVALGMPRFLFHFMIGIVLCRVWVSRGSPVLQLRPVAKALLWGIAVLLYTYQFTLAPFAPTLFPGLKIWYVSGTGAGLLLALVLDAPAVQALLVRPALRQLGRSSYSIYLVHFGLLMAAIPWLLAWIARGQPTLPPLAWYVGLVALVVSTLALAAITERWI
ncbi:MAG: acyltransferase, partial [Gemmatimonadaceae bacterium]|nr:acyltransferase [Gemmatimonadaceae bacterium]